MDNSSLIVGLDIGTTNVKAVIADGSTNQLKIIGSAAVPTEGLDHSNIVDIDQAARAITSVINKAEEKINAKINRVITGLPASLLQLETARGVISVGEKAREITDQDVQNVTAAALVSSLRQGREAVTFLPTKFRVDGEDKIVDPRKMIGMSLEVKGILITAPKMQLHNIKRAIERAGYQNNFFVANPLALADVALDDGERTFGTILLDIGGGQTTATVIHENKIKYATIDLEAGDDITKDISVVLNTSIKEAEHIKVNYGNAEPALTSSDDTFPVNAVGREAPDSIDENYLAQIISARVDQILDRIGQGLESHGALELPGGIVISGGSAEMPGMAERVINKFNVSTRVYTPDQMGLRNSSFAVGYGIVNYVYDLHDIDFLVNSVINNAISRPQQSIPKRSASKESSKFFKRLQQSNETHKDVAYNNDKTDLERSAKATADHHTRENTGSQETKQSKKGFKEFFKKFFD